MGVPSNVIATTGTGAAAISADNFNTYVQGCTTYSTLKGFTGVANMTVYMQGYSAPYDGGQGNFYWNTTTGTDDGGITTIVPNGSSAGCWSRIGNSSSLFAPQTVSNASGNVSLTAANVTNQVLICTGGTAPTNTFPTASAIIGAMPGQQPGAMRMLNVVNVNSGNMILSPGSGVTFTGNLTTGNFVVSGTSSRLLTLYLASASTVTVYG